VTRKPAAPRSVIVGINDDGEPCCAHLYNSRRRDCGSHKTWAAYTLARPAAKSEIAKAVAEATLRANRRSVRVLKTYFAGRVADMCANEILGRKSK
jgi:hypothetical protein